MNTETRNPGFPGKELLSWAKYLMKEFGLLLLKGARRVQAVPKEKWLSSLAIFGMIVLVLVLGGIVGLLLLSPLFWGAIFGLITVGWTIFSILTANNLKLTLAKAKRADDSHVVLIQSVKQLSDHAGIPSPSVWIAEQDDPNAYVCGRNPKHAALVVHTGGLKAWTPDQLKGVLAHEVSHIRNRDVLAMTIAVALYEAMTWICRVYFGGLLGAIESFEKAANRTSGYLKLISYSCFLFGWVLFWITYCLLFLLIRPAGLLLSLAASRQQEYLADRSAAELLGSGEALASALLTMEEVNQAYVEEAAAREEEEEEGTRKKRKERFRLESGWGSLWSTHPPTAKRVDLLRTWESEQTQKM